MEMKEAWADEKSSEVQNLTLISFILNMRICSISWVWHDFTHVSQLLQVKKYVSIKSKCQQPIAHEPHVTIPEREKLTTGLH